MKLIFFLPLVGKAWVLRLYGGFEGFARCFGDKGESCLLFSFWGWSDSGHSTELWLQSPCSHAASALMSQLLHFLPKQHLVSYRAHAYQVELSEGTCFPGFNCVSEFHWKVVFWAVHSQMSERLPESHYPSRKDEWALSCTLLSPCRCCSAFQLPLTWAVSVSPIPSPSILDKSGRHTTGLCRAAYNTRSSWAQTNPVK